MPAHEGSNAPLDPPPRALQAPWREAYFKDEPAGGADAPHGAGAGPPGGPGAQEESSFFRQYWLSPGEDRVNFVVARTGTGLILLNRYPYTGGHLLAALGEGRPRLLDYAPVQRAELWKLAELGLALMERALRPQGVNIGINEGRAAGAGVPQHLHIHLVPRWHGDVNFMTAVANVRVIPASLEAMAERYRAACSALQK